VGERELKKQRTRRSLADAAVRLFTEHGYDNVTMAQVAATAGVSRRTAFRYFPSKDDLVMEYSAEWFDVFDEFVDCHPGLPLEERLRIASHAVAAHIEANPDPVRQLFELAYAHPALAGRYAVSSAQWIDRISAEIQLDKVDNTDARMLAAAVMGIINSVCETWATTDQPMTPLLDRGLDLIAAALQAVEAES
jgi:AcrR family transcriptional regulator